MNICKNRFPVTLMLSNNENTSEKLHQVKNCLVLQLNTRGGDKEMDKPSAEGSMEGGFEAGAAFQAHGSQQGDLLLCQ